MRYLFSILVIVCSYKGFSQLVITSFSPVASPPGGAILIKGSNFSPTSANNIVFFGPVKAAVSWATSDSIQVIVPWGATHDVITVITNGNTAYSAKKFIASIGFGTSLLSSSFDAKQDYLSGNFPYAVSVGDFDGDGKADIVTANYSDATISLFQNYSSPNIVLGPKINYTTSDKPGELAVGDINGDGKPDIVTANDISKTVSVLINTSTPGIISFATRQDFTTGTYAVAVGLGDIDGDGKVDLIELNNQDNTMSVLRNTSTAGSLSFANRVSFSTGSSPIHLGIIDLDQDGKQDVVVTNYFSNSVSILKNTSISGVITFQPKFDILIGRQANGLDIGDLNNDNKPDIVTGNTDTTISILTNTSSGASFSFNIQNKVIGTTPKSVAISDIDGDGRLDLAVAGSAVYISILQNTSTGNTISFSPKIDYYMQGSSEQIKIADINNDGRNDLIVAHFTQLAVIKNRIPLNIVLCPGQTTSFTSNINGSSYQWQANFNNTFANISDNINYSGTNTPTLNISSTPSGWYGAKYRCLVSGVYSDEYLLRFQNTWISNTSGNWEDPFNWNCGSVPDSNTDVKINTGNILINSNVTIRSLIIKPVVQVTVGSGNVLTILH